MDKPLFSKLSREVGLVLISSSLFLAGCNRHQDEDKKDDDEGPGQPAPAGWHGGGGHGGYYPFMGRTGAGLSGGTGSVSTAGSARGGFGATGHAVSAGG
jgi:hypothetical protein